jgi:hypothetical protein
MSFMDISNGTEVFVDANIFVHAYAPDPQLGPPSGQLLERIERSVSCGASPPPMS